MMTILTNPRWEQFSQRVANGESATAAYRAVYKAKDDSAAAHGCRLIRNGKVAARIAELQQATATAAVLSLQEKREFLALIVRSPIGAVDENSSLGLFYRGSKCRRSPCEITLPDKLKAIELDARLAGELKGNNITVNATATAVAGGMMILTEERQRELMEKKRASTERRLATTRLLS